jgi:hypothetical protein
MKHAPFIKRAPSLDITHPRTTPAIHFILPSSQPNSCLDDVSVVSRNLSGKQFTDNIHNESFFPSQTGDANILNRAWDNDHCRRIIRCETDLGILQHFYLSCISCRYSPGELIPKVFAR